MAPSFMAGVAKQFVASALAEPTVEDSAKAEEAE